MPLDTSLRSIPQLSYTFGMKTAISIPDEVFEGAERLAKKTGRSRSRLFSDALREYVARHTEEKITETMNEALDRIGEGESDFALLASRRILERNEW